VFLLQIFPVLCNIWQLQLKETNTVGAGRLLGNNADISLLGFRSYPLAYSISMCSVRCFEVYLRLIRLIRQPRFWNQTVKYKTWNKIVCYYTTQCQEGTLLSWQKWQHIQMNCKWQLKIHIFCLNFKYRHEDGDSMFLWNVYIYVLYTPPNPKTLSLSSPPRKPQVSQVSLQPLQTSALYFRRVSAKVVRGTPGFGAGIEWTR
jgi:hypothetical protein